MSSLKHNPWFVRTASSSRRVRLFCFPYAGGSAASFAGWQAKVDGAVDVCALQLPGRGSRFGEAPYRSMPELVRVLAKIVRGQDDLPFAFFGHSLGALIAFEVASYCHVHGLPAPRRLFVSGCAAPQARRPLRKLHLCSDAELIAALEDFNGTPPEVLRDRDLMALLLPALRADFFLAETYQYQARPPLNTPISVLAGRLDKYATSDTASEWRRETTHACDVRWFAGGHFFIKEERAAILQYLSSELSELRSELGNPEMLNAFPG
jgi:surfactin synthase thioesterase subunit